MARWRSRASLSASLILFLTLLRMLGPAVATLSAEELSAMAALSSTWAPKSPLIFATWTATRDPCAGWDGVICERLSATSPPTVVSLAIVCPTTTVRPWLYGATIPTQARGEICGGGS